MFTLAHWEDIENNVRINLDFIYGLTKPASQWFAEPEKAYDDEYVMAQDDDREVLKDPGTTILSFPSGSLLSISIEPLSQGLKDQKGRVQLGFRLFRDDDVAYDYSIKRSNEFLKLLLIGDEKLNITKHLPLNELYSIIEIEVASSLLQLNSGAKDFKTLMALTDIAIRDAMYHQEPKSAEDIENAYKRILGKEKRKEYACIFGDGYDCLGDGCCYLALSRKFSSMCAFLEIDRGIVPSREGIIKPYLDWNDITEKTLMKNSGITFKRIFSLKKDDSLELEF